MANEVTPLFRGGQPDLTGHATAAITGGRFVGVSADLQHAPGLDTAATGGNIRVATAAAGNPALGVSAADAAINTKLAILRAGNVVPMIADGAITAGAQIQVGTDGKPKALTVTGAPVSATATTGVVGSNNALTYTAVAYGYSGNGITVQILGSTGNSISLSVAVVGNAITVTPATNSSGVITSTAAQVITAIAAAAPAAALVVATNTSTSTGAAAVAAAGPVTTASGADGTEACVVGYANSAAADTAIVYVELV